MKKKTAIHLNLEMLEIKQIKEINKISLSIFLTTFLGIDLYILINF